MAEAPAELRLTFSEPLESGYSRALLVDQFAAPVVPFGGAPDPADPYTLVVPLPELANGTYTVRWIALSAADGHSTEGFFSFAVGDVVLPGAASAVEHGHGGIFPLPEALSKGLGYFGFLLAMGLAVIGSLVLRPAGVSSGSLLPMRQALALGIGTIGAELLAIDSAGAIGSSVPDYLVGSRTGILLLARIGLGFVGGAAVLLLARRGLLQLASALAGGVGLLALLTIVMGGHAAAYASPVPAALDLLHLVSGGVWLSGLVVLAGIAYARRRGRATDWPLPAIVSRFSALALVAIALLTLTGAYASWAETRVLVDFSSGYDITLALKVGVAAVALGLGGLNFLDGGRALPRFGGFDGRVQLEAALAIAVVAVTGVLATQSPIGLQHPVAIQAVSSRGLGPERISLEIRPGRPGPNQVAAVIEGQFGLAPVSVELRLERLDAAIGESRIWLRPVLPPAPMPGMDEHEMAGMHFAPILSAGPTRFVTNAAQLDAGSSWDANVVVLNEEGRELSRGRFDFALDNSGISAGRAAPPVDPSLIIAVLLIGLGVLGGGYALGGGALPRTDRVASRIALWTAAAVAPAMGVAILLIGPRL